MDTQERDTSRPDIPQKFQHIKGWGVDLDHRNRPAYPMERTPPRLDQGHIHEPVQQAEDVEILVSTERPGVTPLFGTTVPPAGLSGNIRRFAFKYSENDIRHWLMLLFADRINMVEGLGDDLMSGHIPNIFSEMGGKAEFTYNREAAMKKLMVAGALVGVAALVLAARAHTWHNRRDRIGHR